MNQRKAYEEKFAAQLEEWNAQVALLKAKANKASAEAKIEYYSVADALQRKHDEAKKKLQELKSASDDAWGDLKNGAENAWTEVKIAFNNATAKFK